MSISKKALLGAMLLGVAVTSLALVAGRANAAPATGQPAVQSAAQGLDSQAEKAEVVAETPEATTGADKNNVQSGNGVQQTGQHSDSVPDTVNNR